MFTRSSLPLMLTLILAMITSACATTPATGRAAPTGEPLHVAVEYDVRDEVVKRKVGESTISSSNSDETITVDTYSTRDMRIAYEHWELRQGSAPVDEVDFYTIAGQHQKAAQIQAERDRIKRRANLSAGAAVGGYAVAAVGLALMYRNAFAFDPDADPTAPGGQGLRLGMLYGGGLVGALGTLAWARSGREKLTPGYVMLGRSEAERTAAGYNQDRQVTPPSNPEPPADVDDIVTVEPGTGQSGTTRSRYRILGAN